MESNTPPMSGPRLSVSTWSLHRTLGQPPIYGVEAGTAVPTTAAHNQGESTLLDLPAKLAAFGIHTLEICHFHLPSRDPGYLSELRAALNEAGLELFSLLIDDGDLTHPQHGERDAAWIQGWLEVAGQLGSRCARVIAGKQPSTPENLVLSVDRLGALADTAVSHNVRLMTENWFGLLSTPEAVNKLLARLNGRVGLCLDFGNWRGPDKYPWFEAIAQQAESCHTKAGFNEKGQIDGTDYSKCLAITAAANFNGPYTLIFDSPALDEWDGLAVEMGYVRPYLSS